MFIGQRGYLNSKELTKDYCRCTGLSKEGANYKKGGSFSYSKVHMAVCGGELIIGIFIWLCKLAAVISIHVQFDWTNVES